MDLRDALAANIRSMRARRSLGQERLAGNMRNLGYTGWYRQTVSKIEKGERHVAAEEIFGLAQVLNTTAMSLMDVSGNGTVHFPNGRETVNAHDRRQIGRQVVEAIRAAEGPA